VDQVSTVTGKDATHRINPDAHCGKNAGLAFRRACLRPWTRSHESTRPTRFGAAGHFEVYPKFVQCHSAAK